MASLRAYTSHSAQAARARRRRRPDDEVVLLRRAGKERLVVVGSDDDLRSANGLDFTNSKQFDAIDDAVALLYYTETIDDVLFDPDNDSRLFELHERPFGFISGDLTLYEGLVERAHYSCKPHPNQVLARQQAAAELSLPADDESLLVLVYKRDSGARRRDRTPFRNTTNGIGTRENGESAPLTLFRQFSHDPYASAVLVWQRQVHVSATIGLVALRIDALYGR